MTFVAVYFGFIIYFLNEMCDKSKIILAKVIIGVIMAVTDILM